jgi:phosphoserine phosphatase
VTYCMRASLRGRVMAMLRSQTPNARCSVDWHGTKGGRLWVYAAGFSLAAHRDMRAIGDDRKIYLLMDSHIGHRTRGRIVLARLNQCRFASGRR